MVIAIKCTDNKYYQLNNCDILINFNINDALISLALLRPLQTLIKTSSLHIYDIVLK